MLSFAAPSAFLALAGLLVPLAIHLWNRRPGRVVPVGALRWLTPGSSRQLRQLQLSQLPLLLLRLLLLGLLVAALAGPRWQPPLPPARPQVLLAPEVLSAPTVAALRPTLDSLRRRGATFHRLAPGFPALPDSALTPTALAEPAPLLLPPPAGPDYWQLAAEAARHFPTGALYLYTDARLHHFRGRRLPLPARLRWQLLPTAPDSAAWLQQASRPNPDTLLLTVAHGSAAATTLRRHRQAWPARAGLLPRLPGLPPLYFRAGAAPRIELRPAPDSVAYAVPVTRPLRVALYHDPRTRALDARSAAAALRAAASATPLRLQFFSSPATPPDSLDWLLWLSDAPVPAALRQRLPAGLHLLTDASGPGIPTDAPIETYTPATSLRLLRRSGPAAGPAQWADAYGRPVLSYRPAGRGGWYRLHTRLHPAWSTLAADGQLPALLLSLLAPDTSAPDLRTLDPGQLRGSVAAEPARVARPVALDLAPWVLLAAALFFAIERLLSQRRPQPTPA
ncbi:BatA domain-containing protein [Hymenobacter sp. B81]|uniref:BatA domain-containing protein n=1 Tax=Hymenobacter sp. B81 TaxID=3344878 RepID=UPI0037DDE260